MVWKCQCECGNIHYASLSNLKSGSVSRCPDCFLRSKGEEKIKEILDFNNIPYELEKTFNTCLTNKNRLCRFDFYVDNKYLIEFDGLQHFKATNGWNTQEHFIQIQENDEIKNQWCKNNNIPLIRIPYYILEFLELKDLQLESTQYLIY